jgi:hypothetical protein
MALPIDAADHQWMRLIERESQLAALQQYAAEASRVRAGWCLYRVSPA